MNRSTFAPETSWSRWRFGAAIGIVFALQLVGIFLLSERQSLQATAPAPPPPTFQLMSAAARAAWNSWLELNDPRFFALMPNWEATRKIGFAEEHKEAGMRWTNEPRYLPPVTMHWGAAWSDYAQAAPREKRSVAGAPPATVTRWLTPPPEVPRHSSFRLTGDLAGLSLRDPLLAPVIVHAEMLSNSIVRLTVDRRGSTFSAVLLESSGFADADRQALDLARSARFHPPPARNRPPLLTGELVVQWHTRPGPMGP